MNKFIEFIVDNSYFTIVIILIIAVYGLVSLPSIKVTQDPEILTPRIFMNLYLPGASPVDIERNIVFPIENELRRVDQIEKITTKVVANYAYVLIVFEYGVDLEKKIKEVEAKINNIKRRLPGAFYFEIEKSLLSDYLAPFLLGLHTEQDSLVATHNLAAALEKIPQIKRVEVVEPEYNITINLDINKINDLGITTTQIANAVKSANSFSASSKINISGQYFQIMGPNGQYQQLENIGNTLLYSAGATPVYLNEVAEIKKQAKVEEVISRYNNKSMRFIKIFTNSDVNILIVKQQISDVIEIFQEQSKIGTKNKAEVVFIFDQSEGVYHIVFSLLENLLQGILILLLVLLFSVGYRSSSVIAIVLPLSFLVAMIGLSLTDYGIQQTSIAGFIIALGLIVDNAIVVDEHAFILNRYKGLSHRNAAIQGASSAISPLLASTITTMLAFVPIFLLTTDAGLYLRSLAVSIWLSLFASLLISITLVTILLAKLGTSGGVSFLPTLPSFLTLLIPFREKIYTRLVSLMVRFRYFAILLFLAVFIYTLHVASQLPIKLFPPVGNPYFTININVTSGLDEQRKNEMAQKIEKKLHLFDEIESVTTVIGAEFPYLDPTIQYLGDIVLLVKTASGEEQALNKLISSVKKSLQNLYLDADISLNPFQFRDATEQADFTIKLTGSDIESLNNMSKQLMPIMQQVNGIEQVQAKVKAEQIVFKLEFLQEHAETLGVRYQDILPFINQLTYGEEITRYRDGKGQEFPVLLKIKTDINDLDRTLREIEVPTLSGGVIPLNEVVRISLQMSQTQITHQQFQAIVEIECWVKDAVNIDNVADNLLTKAYQTQIAEGVTIQLGGSLETRRQTFDGLGKNTAFIAMLIFTVFILQFKSFLQPLIIFSAVPLCIIGAILGLSITGQDLSFLAVVGITSLMGIVVNDSILLVEAGNKIAKEQPGKTLQEIAIEAGKKRFMPVLLTSITTIAGLMPLALGENVFKPMAIAIIGGLISATLLTLLFVPVLYSILSRKQYVNR